MIRTLRAYFLSRALREKLLLFGILGVAVVMWATNYSSRLSGFWRQERSTTAELKDQDMWLARRGEIEAATHAAASKMDPAKTYDATGLTIAVQQVANDAGVKPNYGAVTPGPNAGQFSINSLRLSIPATDWHAFAVFYQHLQERAPYIAITEIAIQPVKSNPSQVLGTINIASFEIKH